MEEVKKAYEARGGKWEENVQRRRKVETIMKEILMELNSPTRGYMGFRIK